MEPIKVNGKYGAMVGNIKVFTLEGAVNAYKLFVRRCYKNLTPESSIVLSDVADDMKRIGFSASALEDMEIEVISEQ